MSSKRFIIQRFFAPDLEFEPFSALSCGQEQKKKARFCWSTNIFKQLSYEIAWNDTWHMYLADEAVGRVG